MKDFPFVIERKAGDPEYDERVEAFMKAMEQVAGFYPESIMQAMSLYFTKIKEISEASDILQDITLYLSHQDLEDI